ncbi:exonuclease [Burkholderia phage BcepSauron]|uniref:Exonuclease n=2 Tax=Sarumanvirus TaxID=2843450 RepID=A0A482MLR6_9CAUD|nr:hypothetical protein H1O16_gp293 [Burkholderia phage BcepSaruman]YP_009904672.1 exonuclease [Burkholderia phage BcepSauron]QBQ74674.1 exonuclease [Burkholderia phage BcepSauron]QBX06706.1 hypothetical protein BcepSaruman_293 [Burkholderia phage BcepSaruman]
MTTEDVKQAFATFRSTGTVSVMKTAVDALVSDAKFLVKSGEFDILPGDAQDHIEQAEDALRSAAWYLDAALYALGNSRQ